MAKRKVVFEVSEKELDIADIYAKGASAPIADLVAAKVILEDQIARCKAAADSLDGVIKGKKYEDVAREFIGTSSDSPDDVSPMVVVHTIDDDTIKVTLFSKEDSGFDASGLKEKSVLDSIVPEKYKKRTVTLDTRALEAAFTDGTLEDMLKSYCSVAPSTVTAMRKTVVVKGE